MHWTSECFNRAQLQGEGEIQSTSPEDTGQIKFSLKLNDIFNPVGLFGGMLNVLPGTFFARIWNKWVKNRTETQTGSLC